MPNNYEHINLPMPQFNPEKFIEQYLKQEHEYFKIARDETTGLTVDGYNITDNGLERRNWTCTSKEALDLAVLTKGLAGDHYALHVIALGNTKEAQKVISGILERKITSYENYAEYEPRSPEEFDNMAMKVRPSKAVKYHGFFGWITVESGRFYLKAEQEYLPALDIGEWLWALYALCHQLKKLSNNSEEARKLYKRYQQLLNNLTQKVCQIFYDKNSKKIMESVKAEVTASGIRYYHKDKDNICHASDLYESIMIILFMILFVPDNILPDTDKKALWNNLTSELYDTEYGPVIKGWPNNATMISAPHTKWPFLFLPLLDIPAAKAVYELQEQLRTRIQHNQNGISAAANTAKGFIEYDERVKAPYGAFPILLYYAAHGKITSIENVGLTWLYQMLNVRGMFSQYGNLEAYELSMADKQHKPQQYLTADGKILIWLALMGGIGDIIKTRLMEENKYEIFYERISSAYAKILAKSKYNLSSGVSGNDYSLIINNDSAPKSITTSVQITPDSYLLLCGKGKLKITLGPNLAVKSPWIDLDKNNNQIIIFDSLNGPKANKNNLVLNEISFQPLSTPIIITQLLLFKNPGFESALPLAERDIPMQELWHKWQQVEAEIAVMLSEQATSKTSNQVKP